MSRVRSIAASSLRSVRVVHAVTIGWAQRLAPLAIFATVASACAPDGGDGARTAPEAMTTAHSDGPHARFFPETGMFVMDDADAGPFYSYWAAHDGLVRLGYPKGPPVRRRVGAQMSWTQMFERAELQHGGECAADVCLTFLGKDDFYRMYGPQFDGDPGDPAARDAAAPRAGCGAGDLAPTGHCTDAAFAGWWTANGGLERWGYPITEGFAGARHEGMWIQYFERGRLELHPGGAVMAGLMGNEEIEARAPVRSLDEGVAAAATGAAGVMGGASALADRVAGERGAHAMALRGLPPNCSLQPAMSDPDEPDRTGWDLVCTVPSSNLEARVSFEWHYLKGIWGLPNDRCRIDQDAWHAGASLRKTGVPSRTAEQVNMHFATYQREGTTCLTVYESVSQTCFYHRCTPRFDGNAVLEMVADVARDEARRLADVWQYSMPDDFFSFPLGQEERYYLAYSLALTVVAGAMIVVAAPVGA